MNQFRVRHSDLFAAGKGLIIQRKIPGDNGWELVSSNTHGQRNLVEAWLDKVVGPQGRQNAMKEFEQDLARINSEDV